jgi:hypothetical protein
MLKELLDTRSNVSSMRMMGFISVITASVLGVIGLLKGVEPSTLGVLCGVFLGSAFGGKVGQKYIESNHGDN